MVRGPICAETNPVWVNTPGPLGCNDATDLNNPIQIPSRRVPLGLWQKKQRPGKSTSVSKRRNKIDAVAKLKRLDSKTVKELKSQIEKALKKSKNSVRKKKKDEEILRLENLRLIKQKVVKDVIAAYGVGMKFVRDIEHSNRYPDRIADTSHDFIVTYDGILVHPGFIASAILHESSHAQRNVELKSAGIDRNSLSVDAEDLWKVLIEIEGYQLEYKYKEKTGLTEAEVKGVSQLLEDHLSWLEKIRNKKTRVAAETGNVDKLQNDFIRKHAPVP